MPIAVTTLGVWDERSLRWLRGLSNVCAASKDKFPATCFASLMIKTFRRSLVCQLQDYSLTLHGNGAKKFLITTSSVKVSDFYYTRIFNHFRLIINNVYPSRTNDFIYLFPYSYFHFSLKLLISKSIFYLYPQYLTLQNLQLKKFTFTVKNRGFV